MNHESSASRGSIRIDLAAERLWRQDEPVALRPKTWAVLRLLIERAEALVTKDELLEAVWPDTAVSEGTLNKSIGELRVALGEDRDGPRFIETVPRRGFRWIGGTHFVVRASEPGWRAMPPPPTPPAAVAAAIPLPTIVGREGDIAALERRFEQAAMGTRQVGFVTGEAGAGKSTLVDAFLAHLDAMGDAVLSAHGQCIEAYGQHEPYRPILEAIERLARHPKAGAFVVETLRSHAPTWLRQMPALGLADATEATDADVTPLRMLREIAAALEEISRQRPLVLVLEDIHWADLATMDACNLLARRRDPARLLVVATLRAADAVVLQHPALAMKDELTSRGLAAEIPLALFTPEAVRDYLATRCGGLELDAEIVWWIHHQTAGNPLFMRILVDDLIQRGIFVADATGTWQAQGASTGLREFVPDSLRELVERQLDGLSDVERRVTEAACVLPTEFSALSLAAMVELSEEETEEVCSELARRGRVLRRVGRLKAAAASDSDRFAFVHSIVQRILQERLSTTRRQRLHRAAAAQLQVEHSETGEEAVAVQLALHFAMAEDPASAIVQLQRAAASIQRIPAPREVVVIRERILDLVERTPDLPNYRRERLVATMNLAEARQLAYAVVDEETAALCERVLELAVTDEDARERFLATMGVFSNRFYAGRYAEAEQIARGLLAAAERYPHPVLLKSAAFAVGGTCYRLGDFDEAATHFESCLLHEAGPQDTYGWNFQSMSLSHLALIAVHRGRPDEARRLIEQADGDGDRGGGPADAAFVPLLAYARAMLRDDAEAMVLAERALARADHLGAAAWIERARFVHGLLLSRQGQVDDGVRRMKESLARQARQPVYLDRSAYCCLLADEMLRRALPGVQEIVDEGLAFMERSGERHFESELHRLRGELGLAGEASAPDSARRASRDAVASVASSNGQAASEAEFRKAIESARGRGARLHELLATTSLARLLHRQGRAADAAAALEPCCRGFAEDGAPAELSEARRLLAALG